MRKKVSPNPDLLGTLNYMAPEYIITSDITPAFDVFSLGICILEGHNVSLWSTQEL